MYKDKKSPKIDKHLAIGFILNNLGRNQVAYTCISAINRYNNDSFGLNLNIFFKEQETPCINPVCGRFHARDSLLFNGHLIATDLENVKILNGVHLSHKYFYINNLPSILNNKHLSDPILKDKTITKFCRSKDYRDELLKLQYDISDCVVEDFNMNQILELINAQCK